MTYIDLSTKLVYTMTCMNAIESACVGRVVQSVVCDTRLVAWNGLVDHIHTSLRTLPGYAVGCPPWTQASQLRGSALELAAASL
jgi:hypothetical protein